MNDIEWQPQAKTLVDALAEQGELADPVWRRAFEQTPRHVFVPRFWQLGQYNIPTTLVDGCDPGVRTQWLEACYRNQALVTRWVADGERRAPVSSASAPSLVARMLRLLDIHGGEQVLEVGTGTGWNAALLCHRLGETNVTTVDIDAVMVAEAQAHLHRCGYGPRVEVADGRAGYPATAPYDRIVATAATDRVPAAWIDQLTDGGLIVAPLTMGGALTVLRKTGPEEVSGRLDDGQAWFMPLHDKGVPSPEGFLVLKPQPAATPIYRGTTDVDPAAWADPDFRLWLALHLPHGRIADTVDDAMTRTGVVMYTSAGRASVDYSGGGEAAWPIVQDHERLWDTVEAVWAAWQRYDRPARTRLGVTARTDGQQWAWLDAPDGPLRWPLPAQ